MDSNLLMFLIIVAVSVAAFLLLRSVAIWYWKIDEHLDNQRKIISLLEDIKLNKTEKI